MLNVCVALWVPVAVMSGNEPGQLVRIAAFNVWELSSRKLDQVDEHGRGVNLQLRKAAEIVQRVRPDVLLINEFDYDAGGVAAHAVEVNLRLTEFEAHAAGTLGQLHSLYTAQQRL